MVQLFGLQELEEMEDLHIEQWILDKTEHHQVMDLIPIRIVEQHQIMEPIHIPIVEQHQVMELIHIHTVELHLHQELTHIQ